MQHENPCYQLTRCSTAAGLLYALIVDLPDGIATVPVRAENPEEAFATGHDLFPGCRLAVVLADGQPGTELD